MTEHIIGNLVIEKQFLNYVIILVNILRVPLECHEYKNNNKNMAA